jgi:hypothetical protein
LFIAAGDVSRDRFVDDQPLDYMLVTPNVDAANAMLGDAAAAGPSSSSNVSCAPSGCAGQGMGCGISIMFVVTCC